MTSTETSRQQQDKTLTTRDQDNDKTSTKDINEISTTRQSKKVKERSM